MDPSDPLEIIFLSKKKEVNARGVFLKDFGPSRCTGAILSELLKAPPKDPRRPNIAKQQPRGHEKHACGHEQFRGHGVVLSLCFAALILSKGVSAAFRIALGRLRQNGAPNFFWCFLRNYFGTSP